MGGANSRGNARALLLGPALAVFLALLIVPMLNVIALSLHPQVPGEGIGSAWTLENYRQALMSSTFREVLVRTLWLSVVVTVLDFLLAYPVAYAMARWTSPVVTTLLYVSIISPLLISVVVRTFGWVLILSPNGLVNELLRALHLSTGSWLYNQIGVIIGMTHILLPLMLLPIWASLQGLDRSVEEAAATLGAGAWSTFLRVTLPLSIPGVAAGSLIVFALTMSGYVTPVILGGPRAGYLMAALIAGEATMTAEWTRAAAAAVILFAILIPIVWVHGRVERWLGRYAV